MEEEKKLKKITKKPLPGDSSPYMEVTNSLWKGHVYNRPKEVTSSRIARKLLFFFSGCGLDPLLDRFLISKKEIHNLESVKIPGFFVLWSKRKKVESSPVDPSQNGGFSMAMLVYRSVQLKTMNCLFMPGSLCLGPGFLHPEPWKISTIQKMKEIRYNSIPNRYLAILDHEIISFTP